jgi:hypothetical protein
MATSSPAWPAISDAEFEQIREETKQRDLQEPRVHRTTYDARTKMLCLAMVDGVELRVPIHSLRGFEKATPEQIAAAKIVSNGTAIHWDELDVQATVIAIIQRVMHLTSVAENARKAGSARSEAKSRAARENGRKGGRPRKAQLTPA